MTLTEIKRRLNGRVPILSIDFWLLTIGQRSGKAQGVNKVDNIAPEMVEETPLPPIRRPVIFYASVTVAYGFLAAAIIALILV